MNDALERRPTIVACAHQWQNRREQAEERESTEFRVASLAMGRGPVNEPARGSQDPYPEKGYPQEGDPERETLSRRAIPEREAAQASCWAAHLLRFARVRLNR